MSLDLPSLLLQPGRRPLLRHISLFNVRCPKCCSHRIRKCKQDTRNRHQFQQDSCNTEANTYLSAHLPNPKTLTLVPHGGDLPSVRCFILLNMLLPLRTVPLLQLKIPRMSRWSSASPLQYHKHDRPNYWYEVQR